MLGKERKKDDRILEKIISWFIIIMSFYVKTW